MLEVSSKVLPIRKTHKRRNYQHTLVDATLDLLWIKHIYTGPPSNY